MSEDVIVMDDPGPQSKAELDTNGTATTPSGFALAIDGGRVLPRHELNGDSSVVALPIELGDHTGRRAARPSTSQAPDP